MLRVTARVWEEIIGHAKYPGLSYHVATSTSETRDDSLDILAALPRCNTMPLFWASAPLTAITAWGKNTGAWDQAWR